MLVVAIAVLGSVTVLPGIDVTARRPHREGSGAVRAQSSPSCDQELGRQEAPPDRREPRVDRDPSRRAAPARAVRVIAGWRAWCCSLLPLIGMKTALPGNSDLPKNLPIVQTLDRLSTAFPGGPRRPTSSSRARTSTRPPCRLGFELLSQQAAASGQMSAALTTRVNAAGTVAEVSIPLNGDGSDSTSVHALKAPTWHRDPGHDREGAGRARLCHR